MRVAKLMRDGPLRGSSTTHASHREVIIRLAYVSLGLLAGLAVMLFAR